ncbi:MAG: SIR2 family protein [Planctomycetota bacterium]
MQKDRSTLVIGNGLGMALDANRYSLSSALNSAWFSTGVGALSANDKQRVVQCLPTDDLSIAPSTEEELEVLQRVITACDFLNSVGESDIHWLSQEGRKFPRAVRRYFGKTASCFHGDFEGLPNSFCESICSFISNTKSHVATLNYDDLLYRPFISKSICCSGYSGCLVDGFHDSGFAPENLERRYGRSFGWYLHLHGSPLFAEDDSGVITKIPVSNLPHTHSQRKHLILTHHSFKLPILQSSPVLECYWQHFRLAMIESKQLVVLGYSGADDHVNRRIRSRLRKQNMYVHVIEWVGSGPKTDRIKFWRKALGKLNCLTQLDNILDFDFEKLRK